MDKMTFDKLNLIDPIARAVKGEGYEAPTPIQERTIPHLLAGEDLLGTAQTGTGKTAAFALPILQLLAEGGRSEPKQPRALVLTPTRELAVQVGRSFATYGKNLKLRNTVVYGGVNQNPQARALAKGVDILVATPGRLLDLIGQRLVRLDKVEFFILDEADRMLDMGFIHDINKLVELIPFERQTIFFSATMPPQVRKLADKLLNNPTSVAVNPTATTADKIEQRVMFVDKNDKEALLHEVLKDESVYKVLVFTRTKHRANKLSVKLNKMNVKSDAIHGNKSQFARQSALKNFMNGKTRVLVATDVAARGIDVDGITHVINFELPNEPESYVHRIGRTARADAEGIAISFCDIEEKGYLRSIEQLIKNKVEVDENHPFHSEKIAKSRGISPSGGHRGGGRPHGRGGARPSGHRTNAGKGGGGKYFAKGKATGRRQQRRP